MLTSSEPSINSRNTKQLKDSAESSTKQKDSKRSENNFEPPIWSRDSKREKNDAESSIKLKDNNRLKNDLEPPFSSRDKNETIEAIIEDIAHQ